MQSPWLRCFLSALVIVTSLALAALAQTSKPTALEALPQDTGKAGLQQMLRKLGTTGRLLHVVAHPDDEDGGMLTLEARGKGVTTSLMTLTRGEGGQNKVGSSLFDVLGVLRTLELTASDRYYGVEQRFSRVADFGFSKSPDETFQKWGGHEVALGDVVRVIRTFQPDVVTTRFSGTSRDGHGHHQASGILAQEAFRAAADPNRFPEQIKEGLLPWQAKKLYIGNVCGFGGGSCADENYTLRVNTGTVDPALGESYIQFALDGLRHQLSQGAGGWSVEPGDRFTYYKLVDSTLSKNSDKSAHEKDFFAGIDTSLSGLAIGEFSGWSAKLKDIQQQVETATKQTDPSATIAPLVAAMRDLRKVKAEIGSRNGSQPGTRELLLKLTTKEAQLKLAINLAAGISLRLTANARANLTSENGFVAVPDQTFAATAQFTGPKNVALKNITLDLPKGWKSQPSPDASNNSKSGTTFQITVPDDAQFTRPYWLRDNPETDSIYRIDDPQYTSLPFPPPPIWAQATYLIEGETETVDAVGVWKPSLNSEADHARAIAVAPAFSVSLEPGSQVIAATADSGSDVKVGISHALAQPAKGTLHLEVPNSWRVEPAQLSVSFDHQGQKQDFHFRVFPANLRESRAEIRAVLESGSKKYSEGYSVVTRADLDTFYYYQPAVQRVSIVDVKVPKDLKIGYVMGAGDDIVTVLQQIGLNVTVIPPEKVGGEDLSKYGTIVLGIRAYDTQKDVAANNKKLLDYVSAGGTLVVQYNADTGNFNSGHFTPYPVQMGRSRVSVEEAPVNVLAQNDSIFHSPNEISQRDFDGWVQERGLYFADQWDDHFTPLLASHDPGEQPQKGGLLRAQFGKGTYIYTGYAFFRQLPAGVPGATRLFVNLLSVGHASGR